jgi:lipoprotein-anchoring transpeptidase ErfK/SrfK
MRTTYRRTPHSSSSATNKGTSRIAAGRFSVFGVLFAGSILGGVAQTVSAQTTTTVAATSSSSDAPTSTLASGTSSTPTTLGSTNSSSSSSVSATSLAPAPTGPTIPSGGVTTVPGVVTTVPGSDTSSTIPSTIAPTTTLAPFVAGRTLRVGMRGDDVLALEQRLDLLKFEVGPIDGKFDYETWQGVMAFQKLNGLPRTAKFDAKTQKLFAVATTPGGVIPNGGLPRVEVDITRQVMLYFDKYGLAKVIAISSGNNKKYCSTSQKTKAKVCGNARTPRGNFKIQRRISGKRESDLGTLLNPIYFTGGFAIHGSPSVPAGPASHGCVRVTNKFSQWTFDNIKNGTPVYVFD